jgi:hypothetical protein
MNLPFLSRAIGLAGFALILCAPGNAVSAAQYDFNGPGFVPTFGSGSLGFWSMTTTGAVQYGTASSFGLPAMPGGDAGVMRYPAFDPTQGLILRTGAQPNGGGAFINQYTMVWDLLLPQVPSYAGLFNTDDSNTSDGDFFIKAGGGIGISGTYSGTISANKWYRIAASFDLTTSTLSKYIDGTLVGTQSLSSGVDGRWSLYSANDPTRGVLLLTDDDGETGAGFINSFLFVDRAMTSTEIAALGGPNALGIVPEPGTTALLLVAGVLAVIRRRRSH